MGPLYSEGSWQHLVEPQRGALSICGAQLAGWLCHEAQESEMGFVLLFVLNETFQASMDLNNGDCPSTHLHNSLAQGPLRGLAIMDGPVSLQ